MPSMNPLIESLDLLANLGRAARKKPTGASTVKEVTPAGTDVPDKPEHHLKDNPNVR